MSIDAITRSDDSLLSIPESSDDWAEWVSATRTRNYVLGDPLLDWLELYGNEQGFERDTALPDYDARTDFTEFIFRKGAEFEEAVVSHLRTLTDVLTISSGPADVRDLVKAEETFEAMRTGTPIIYQGVLRDAENRVYGAPDLLVRSDILLGLFPNALTDDEAMEPAPDLGDVSWHYRVVDIKFATLGLTAGGELDNNNSAPAYKAQVFVYNRALGRLQGVTPPVSHLLGRGWRQRRGRDTFRGTSCMELLAPVPQMGSLAGGYAIADAVDDACQWIGRTRADGVGWRALPQPAVPELYPNMGNDEDAPWHAAKKQIADELDELTLLWQVGPAGRRQAHATSIQRWTDPECTPEAVDVKGPKQAPTLQAILDINRAAHGPPVAPPYIQAAEEEWRSAPPVEFYVDFETVEDLDDDFSRIPEKGGQPLIFMVGCGHVENGEWQFAQFTVDALTEGHEAGILDAWFAHMAAVRQRLDPDGDEPRLFHWSHHEPTQFETAYNSAKARHVGNSWPTPRWFDFLREVMTAQPVVVRGSLEFGLKPVAKALNQHGLLETVWGDGPLDGLGAMVGAWSCAQEAAERGSILPETALMQEIGRYNEVDCRAMQEIVQYLRSEH